MNELQTFKQVTSRTFKFISNIFSTITVEKARKLKDDQIFIAWK